MQAIKFKNNRLFYLDQRLLPIKEVWRECKSLKDGVSAIKNLEVRGAPLIGIFAGYVVYIESKKFFFSKKNFLRQLDRTLKSLKNTRPTAVNLFWILEKIESAVKANMDKDIDTLQNLILEVVKKTHLEDINSCKRIANFGVRLINETDTILTHCNSGFLATSGEGTALGIIYQAYKKLKNIKVYVDETRPLLQGARLTIWELQKKHIPCILICDDMAAYLMKQSKIDKIIVGADRISAYGDVANKIGTYNLAVLANYHKIPFYVAAPFSSFDLKIKNLPDTLVEQRDPNEVRKVFNKIYITPKDVKVYNPAFDITPSRLITAIVTDKGIIYPPYKKNIKNIFAKFF
ncbi:MAG: S-methyl-5-thioribose-1-phosphate isomerase [Candidatus Omnitrophica bacterium]|nr:S-methyl-5-thioribose-1-phosphate isomerase [Candidatus Omnitrophota bacterium]